MQFLLYYQRKNWGETEQAVLLLIEGMGLSQHRETFRWMQIRIFWVLEWRKCLAHSVPHWLQPPRSQWTKWGLGGPGACVPAVLEPEPRQAGPAGTRTQTTSCGVLGPAPGPPGRKLRLRELVIIPAFRDCCAVQSNNTSENVIDGGEKKMQQFL